MSTYLYYNGVNAHHGGGELSMTRPDEGSGLQHLFQDALSCYLYPHSTPTSAPTVVHLIIATSKALDLMEGRPMRHGLRVAAMAGIMAQTLHLSQRETVAVVFSGLLHDIGLGPLAPELLPLLPPGTSIQAVYASHTLEAAGLLSEYTHPPLSAEAKQLLHTHSQTAATWLDKLAISADVAETISYHHEYCDGSGYPSGLLREAIPICGRVLALADCMESVMQDANGLTGRQEALAHFLERSDVTVKFDPEVVDAARHSLQHESLLRQLYTLEVEPLIMGMLPTVMQPMTPRQALAMVQAMGRLSDDLMPTYTKNHSGRVADLSLRMAYQLGIGAEQCGELLFASLLHDLGKLAVPVSILLKQGMLTKEEWAVIRDYPRRSEEVLRSVPGFRTVAAWAGEHHERINGSGYPGGLKANEISIAGRIIGLADVFDALTSVRPYRSHSYDPMDALPIIEQGRFRLYDNKLVNVLRKVLMSSEIAAFAH